MISIRKSTIGLSWAGVIATIALSIFGVILAISPEQSRTTIGLLIIVGLIFIVSSILISILIYKEVRSRFYSLQDNIDDNLNKFLNYHKKFQDQLNSFGSIENSISEIQSSLSSFSDNENIILFRNICKFDEGPIAIVASAVATAPDSTWEKHFLYSTGSGQFYGLSFLLPMLLKAYPERELHMFLSPHVEYKDLEDFNIILLGGSPTNPHTHDFIDELTEYYDIPLDYRSGKDWHEFIIHSGKEQDRFIVDLENGKGRDYGVLLKYTRPTKNARKVLFLIGGSTSGTEAAAKFITTHEARSKLSQKDNFVCIVNILGPKWF